MERLIIQGGQPLIGRVQVSGAKNASLPILAGCLLSDHRIMLSNVPQLKDVSSMIELLGVFGVRFTLDEHMNLEVDAGAVDHFNAPLALVKSMRASILVLGPLLSRYGQAKVALPGGCAIGSRPVDIHLDGLRAMGAKIVVHEDAIEASAPEGLRGTIMTLSTATVTGTENLMMAAVLAKGTTIIHNAAREPEVKDCADFLNSLGAKILGAGTETLVIEGVAELTGGEYHIMPDRIEAGTFLIAAAVSGGKIRVNQVSVDHLEAVVEELKAAGVVITHGEDWIEADMRTGALKAVDITTSPYPGFPTDLQAQWIALNTVAQGQAAVTEAIFENRFMHVVEMNRMGANIDLEGNMAHSAEQPQSLQGVEVKATDLRASASLLLCAMVAEGETVITHIHHIDRGYSHIEEKFIQLGADIKRVPS